MVKIRLRRVGKAKQPAYRVVVADSRSPRDGRIIESIGHYNPRLEPSEIVIDSARAVYWLRHGAQPSDQVRKLLRISGAWAEFTGQPAPAARPAPEEARRRATPAGSVTAAAEEADEEQAETPESANQAAAAEAGGEQQAEEE